MLRRLIALLGLVLLVVSVGGSSVRAQTPISSGFEQIHAYDVDITIDRSGELRIIESIAYDFGSYERHGIDRAIPVVARYDKHNDRVYSMKVESVTTSSGTPAQHKVETIEGGHKRIRIGDPDTTITGRHTYTITYTISGALNAFDDHDELYWNAIGDAWSVSISNVSVHVHTPGDLTAVACYAGPRDSRLGCTNATSSGKGAEFSQTILNPYEATTVVIALAKGVISPSPTPILREHWTFDQAFAATPFTIGASGSFLAILLVVFGWLGYTRGRDRRAVGSTVDAAFATGNESDERVPLLERVETPIEFEPPEAIRPGQVGVLIDEHANPLDVTATIIDLAVRGYLRIEEIEQRGWFKRGDWKMTKLKESEGLLDYEGILLDGLFEGGSEVQLSELRNNFAPRLAKVQNAMYDEAVRQGWFAEDPEKARSRWRMIGWAVAIGGLALTVAAAKFTHLGLIPIPMMFAGYFLTKVAKTMPSRSAKGTAMHRRVAGFRRLIESPTEVGHAQFNERNDLFSTYLPFAIVFGCTGEWAKAFEDLDAASLDTSNWYSSGHPFNVRDFSSSMNDFSTMTTGAVAATLASSSSGGSGFSGGSSGGGGGGGGGGSW
ncbi:MAG: DUF2207 domain-containing protein [Acidimicrobiales bacterium]